MDYSQFLLLKEELSLILVIVILFVADLFMSPDAHKNDGKPVLNTMLPVVLLTIHTLITIVPGPVADAFGGMYHNQPIQSIVKSILSIGTLIVFLMAHEWMRRPDTAIKQGEFYILTLSTLLGMYFMISAGHFLMFFIGLETASIPMAALVAFDKYRHHSAEAGAKYILTALFSSGLLLYGLSLIYGTVGTLYFADIPARLTGDPLQIMAFVFFFSGMGFKISLVPFHLWTADVYEGAPSTVTAYLSVISKGSAAFVLMAILIKVFAPMAGSAVLGYHRLHHNCQPLRPTPAEPEAVDGFLQYLASRLHHAGCHQRKRTRYDVAGILRADIYVCQSCRIYRYHDCGTAGRQVHT